MNCTYTRACAHTPTLQRHGSRAAAIIDCLLKFGAERNNILHPVTAAMTRWRPSYRDNLHARCEAAGRVLSRSVVRPSVSQSVDSGRTSKM